MLILADARRLPVRDSCIQCVVTSPPYWGLRDYGIARQIGRDVTPEAYVAEIVCVFDDIRRALVDDGVLWLNLGDSYQNGKGQSGGVDPKNPARRHGLRPQDVSVPGLKPKDLVGIPWMVAFALRSAGWYLRADVIWSKPNAMPESVTDRPTKSHEYLFLLSKSLRYSYNADAIRNLPASSTLREIEQGYEGQATKDYAAAGVQNPSSVKARIIAGKRDKQRGHSRQMAYGSNARSVWTIATKPYSGAHFATMPEKLAELCILAGSRPGDWVLDPFGGSGTTVRVARRFARRGVMLDLNPMYLQLAAARIRGVQDDLLERSVAEAVDKAL